MATSVVGNLVTGDVDVTTAGTAVQVDTIDHAVKSLTIIAKDTNTGRIYYGGIDVASSTQLGLAAGDSVTLTTKRSFLLSDFYTDSSVNGEGVDFVAVM